MAHLFSYRRKPAGLFGFDSSSTAEEVTQGIDASHLTAIITGASSGIGFESARVLALRGAQVVMAVRNVDAGEEAKRSILIDNMNAKVKVLKVDLSSIQSIHNFCSTFKSMKIPLNILINNAGIMGCPFELSNDGIELQFATNYLGHFLLTKLLLHTMISTAKESKIEGRIINVSSEAHYLAGIGGFQFDALNDKTRYLPFLAYAKSKLASILHANELSKRLKDEGANVTINSLHPGIILTNIIRNSHFLGLAAGLAAVLERIALLFLKTIPQGAATQCFLALHPSLKGVSGKYFQNCTFSKRSNYARDPILALKLWEFSEILTPTSETKEAIIT